MKDLKENMKKVKKETKGNQENNLWKCEYQQRDSNILKGSNEIPVAEIISMKK